MNDLKKVFVLLMALCAATATTFSQEADVNLTPINQLFADIDSVGNDQPRNDIFWGKHPETYTFGTVEQMSEDNRQYAAKLTELKLLPTDDLSTQEKISREVMILRLENWLSSERYKIHLMPYNAEGGFFTGGTFFLPRLPFSTTEDYEAYLGWLPSYADYLKYNQSLMEQGLEQGVVRPKVIVQNLIKLLDVWVTEDWTQQPFGEPFTRMPETIGEADQQRLTAEGQKVIEESIIPTYQALKTYLENDYLTASPEVVGIASIPNGKEYYEDRVRHFTTLDISPDSVFDLGNQEVQRIRALMDGIIEELEFEGSFADFLEFLRTDPQFYAQTPQELLNYAAWLSKKAEGALPPLFGKLYSLPFTVAPVPDAIAPTYTGGRYVGGSRELNRPGTYWVNTYNLPSRTLYTLPALTLHEASPGHHLQNALAAESDLEVPDFRKRYYISAFGEGWGLYSEYLGEEMGMYETPYDLFGRYTYEMWRACRLVVDVGMHYKGWTREQAVEFMSSNTALSLHEVNSEIDRYIGWPGQALSYKVGELTIKSLREYATRELGDDFDIQEFHHHILKNGSVPLTVLRSEIEAYVAEKKLMEGE